MSVQQTMFIFVDVKTTYLLLSVQLQYSKNMHKWNTNKEDIFHKKTMHDDHIAGEKLFFSASSSSPFRRP